MIHGIGTDLLDAERIRSGLVRFGEHYADRILPNERWVLRRRDPARFRPIFCHEAFRPGPDSPGDLRNIAVRRDAPASAMKAHPNSTPGSPRGTAHVCPVGRGDLVLAYVILETT
jgi:holo-[acyl-carrier protein] synthase